ncbi:hypothetical protein ACFL6M_07790, partial [Candidatus Eisenbacteria bacterium]
WFRILHVAVVGHIGAAAVTCREQTVEIALGPKGTFQNSNVGTLTRRVPADRIVGFVRSRRGKPKPPRECRTPRVIELLRKAVEWRTLLEPGDAANQAEIARREGITRARVTQVMKMLYLAPEIQRHILSMPDVVRRPSITERALRPIAQIPVPTDQRHAFRQLLNC